MRNELLILTAFALGACLQPVPLGSDDDSTTGGCGDALMPVNVTCPDNAALGAVSTPATPQALQTALVGRWAFCGGTRRGTGRGPVPGFFGGAGVEFWMVDGSLRFAFLLETDAGFRRRSETWTTGTVRIDQVGGVSRVMLEADDGVSAPWALEVFGQSHLLRNSVLDEWNFVGVD